MKIPPTPTLPLGGTGFQPVITGKMPVPLGEGEGGGGYMNLFPLTSVLSHQGRGIIWIVIF